MKPMFTLSRFTLLLAAVALLPLAARADSKFMPVTFEQLSSYYLELPVIVSGNEAEAKEASMKGVPEEIRKLDKKDIVLTGFMLPLATDKGKVTEFLLVRDQMMCCYGGSPAINEWVVVKMKNGGVNASMDVPVTVSGTLFVEAMYENGFPVGIYHMDGQALTES